MKLQEIKGIAKQMGLTVGKMNKGDSIRAIQTAEGNPACYNTDKAAGCGQANCLWREDCR